MIVNRIAIFIFLLFIPIGYIEALNLYGSQQTCPHPHIQNGRFRIRHRTKLVKFTCLPRYELVGNRYATCMNGLWDVPMPVCVRSGCPELPVPNDALQMKSHKDAWVVTFCMPGYKLQGSSIIYCDGYKWNGTAPICIDEDSPVGNDAKCDFDNPSDRLCGWMQDELHDFDWRRWNKKTPSYFIRTGPSFDHTLGDGKNGYYMYLEGTGVQENFTARLLSPVIDYKLSADGCFSFYYHMYGRNMGGLRVYQKPDSIQLQQLLQLSLDERKNYILFEQWGNQGDLWYGAAPPLNNIQEDFQIVMEGVQGKSYFNDIAFDDVAILQGENCTKFRNTAPTPNVITGSCHNRCSEDDATVTNDCKCSPLCELTSSCCEDYVELCIWNNNNGAMTTEADETSSTGKPQTEKFIFTTTSTTTTTTTTQPPTTTLLTTKPTTQKTTKPPTTPKTTKPPTTTVKRTSKLTTTKRVVTTTKRAIIQTSTPQTTTKVTTPQITTKLVPSTKVTTKRPIVTTKDYREINRQKSQAEIQIQAIVKSKSEHNKSSTFKTAIITIVVLALLATLTYLAVMSRTSRGWISLARWRGRATHDPEVRYLNSNDDDL